MFRYTRLHTIGSNITANAFPIPARTYKAGVMRNTVNSFCTGPPAREYSKTNAGVLWEQVMPRLISNVSLFVIGYYFVTREQTSRDIEKESRADRAEKRANSAEQREIRKQVREQNRQKTIDIEHIQQVKRDIGKEVREVRSEERAKAAEQRELRKLERDQERNKIMDTEQKKRDKQLQEYALAAEAREIRKQAREQERELREKERSECERETQQLERNRQVRERSRETREMLAFERAQLSEMKQKYRAIEEEEEEEEEEKALKKEEKLRNDKLIEDMVRKKNRRKKREVRRKELERKSTADSFCGPRHSVDRTANLEQLERGEEVKNPTHQEDLNKLGATLRDLQAQKLQLESINPQVARLSDQKFKEQLRKQRDADADASRV